MLIDLQLKVIFDGSMNSIVQERRSEAVITSTHDVLRKNKKNNTPENTTVPCIK